MFLKQPEVAVISTIDEFGRPRSAPIWFLWEDGAAYMFTARRTLKWRNLQSRPYASLCVDKRDAPYSSVVMDGSVSLRACVVDGAAILRGEKRTFLCRGIPRRAWGRCIQTVPAPHRIVYT